MQKLHYDTCNDEATTIDTHTHTHSKLKSYSPCVSLLPTWTDPSSSHLCGHQPGQMFNLGISTCRLNRRVRGLEGCWHDIRQIHHADKDLNKHGF